MKFTPLDDLPRVTGIDDDQHAILRGLLFLAGGVLRHAPTCSYCGSGVGPCGFAELDGPRANGTTTATTLVQDILWKREKPMTAGANPADIKRRIRPRRGKRRGIRESAVPPSSL